MLSRLPLLAFALLVAISCGGVAQGRPVFREAQGMVDQPCTASTKLQVSHCTAVVRLVNSGGEGLGHATIAIPLKDAIPVATSARTVKTAVCGSLIPDTIASGFADLSCDFELPLGMSVAGAPGVQQIDFIAAASTTSSGGDGVTSIAGLVLAALAAILAAVALLAGVARLRPATIGQQAPSARQHVDQAEKEDDDW